MTSNSSFVGVPPSSEKPSSVRTRFQQIASEKSQPENTMDWFLRNAGQLSSRVAETVVGYPGNLKQAVNQSGEQLKSYLPKSLGLDTPQEVEEKTFGKPEQGSIEEFIMNPPTSKEIREKVTKKGAKALTGNQEFFEPRGEGEKFAGELAEDITSFYLPGTRGMRTMTRLGAPIVANLGKEGAKYLGASPETADNVKLGLMLATSLAGESNPGQFASQRIQQAKQMIPDWFNVNALPLANRLLPLYQRMTRGLNVPSKSRAMQGMRELADQVQNGQLNMRSLMDARDNINEWISEAGGWDVPTNTRNATVRNLNDLKRQIIDTIDQNMTRNFPEAAELYRTGYEAAAVNHQSNAISRFIEKNFGKKAASIGAKLLFPALGVGGAILPKTAAAGALAYPFYKTGQVLYRTANSATLSQYYQNVIQNSIRGNVPAMIKSMDKFDKAMLKEEKKEEKNRKPSLEEFKERFKNKG